MVTKRDFSINPEKRGSMKAAVLLMITAAIGFGAYNKTFEAIGAAILSESGHAVELVLSLTGAICLWSGLMRIAQDSGLTNVIARLLRPFLRGLFRGMRVSAHALRLIAMNVTANLLGLGNAATPLGLSAMRELAKDAPKGEASDAMILFTVMNTASIQLIPTTAAMLRLKHGAAAPFDILPAVLITSFAAAGVSVVAVRLVRFWKGGRR